jgi:hypothetical protein
MSAARALLDYEQRLQVLGELAAYPPGERLLARLVILEGVTLTRALRARVADVDLTAGRLTIAGERSRSRVVALDGARSSSPRVPSASGPPPHRCSSITRAEGCIPSASGGPCSPPRGAPGCPRASR